LRALHKWLAGQDDVLPDDGSVRVASLVSVAVGEDETLAETRARVCNVLGRLLAATDERALSEHDAFAADEDASAPGETECARPAPVACAAAPWRCSTRPRLARGAPCPPRSRPARSARPPPAGALPPWSLPAWFSPARSPPSRCPCLRRACRRWCTSPAWTCKAARTSTPARWRR